MRILCKFLVALLLALALPAWAQAPARIAWIGPGSAAGHATRLSAFKDGMRENGLLEGKHFVVDERYAEGQYERLPALTDELLKGNPAVIMVTTLASVRAAQHATKTVAIVFVNTNDPVGNGLVASFAQPGGNTTGLTNQAEDTMAKYVELLHEVLPRAARVAVLSNSGNASNAKLFDQVRAAAGTFGIATRAFEAASPEGLDATFKGIAQHRPDALLVISDAMFIDQHARISAFALRQRIPSFVPTSDFVASGSLIAYASSRLAAYRRAAEYVRKILAGAKPADLPVEQPTRFDLTLNLKTAKALGITIPYTVMLRATEVIE
jgi:putative tryptophan/tyrosine transport system substrate-binding protein